MRKSCPASFQLKPAFQSFSILATFLLFEIVCQQRNLAATLIFNFRQFQFNSKNSKLSAAKVQSVKDLNMFEKWNCQQGNLTSRLTLIFSSRKVDCRLFPCNFVWPTMSPGFSGLDCNRPLEKSDPYELSSDFGCYLPLFDNLYFRPKTILSFCLASPPSNACQKSEIFQIWKCLKYIRLSFCPIQTSFQACSRCPSQR